MKQWTVGNNDVFVEVDVFEVELGRESLGDVLLAGQFELDQRLADPLAVLLGILDRVGQRIGGDDVPSDQDFA